MDSTPVFYLEPNWQDDLEAYRQRLQHDSRANDWRYEAPPCLECAERPMCRAECKVFRHYVTTGRVHGKG